MKFIAIINANSGKGRGKKDWHLISSLLTEAGILFDFVFTEYKMHAYELIQEYAFKGFANFIAVGGDGTLNEMANGIMEQKYLPISEISLGVIPVGKGNDWCRSFGIPFDYAKSVRIIKEGFTVMQDVGKVYYYQDDKKFHRYFVNVAGMGFDAAVAKKANIEKERGGNAGELAYFKHIFSCLMNYKSKLTKFMVDGSGLETQVFSMNVGIGRFNGGGMEQLPDADPSDGIFDINIIKKISVLQVLIQVRRLFDGTIKKMPQVEQLKGTHIQIESESPVELEADGESLGHSPFEFELLPECLRVYAGNISQV
jgi:diacylglycerol kinase (ATP)